MQLKIAYLTAAVLLLLAAGPAQTQSSKGERDVEFTFTSEVWSEYLFSSASIIHDRPVLQSSITAFFPEGYGPFPRGCYTGIWWSVGLDGTDLSSDFGDEIDVYAGCTMSLGKFSFDMGLTYFDQVDLLSGSGGVGDVLQPYFEVTRDFAPNGTHVVTPYMRAEANVLLKDIPGLTDGVYWKFGAKHLWRPSPLVSLRHRAELIYDTGVFGLSRHWLFHWKGGLDWHVSDRVTVSMPLASVASPFSSLTSGRRSISDGRNIEVVYGAGLKIHF